MRKGTGLIGSGREGLRKETLFTAYALSSGGCDARHSWPVTLYGTAH